ncbi:sigma-70 family RNA polymerase sigma factor [Paenibacillus sp. HN-1]|uniref:sigma-70 family RNA polymerase sigma factor n=1 Tax=Paenibacillus TaxID=44249 RepID=UPI001CA94D2D|nr:MULTISPECIES: sigma-70 family RNA polymerase sigma factor [Paenibacillus]MBY9078797.1 sigma-70 family RNA polymerase sigma factor [Paenibacillus sp. CGMCC 1.18879]MBY9088043.1 sigma-70 family RNA polymerase sigma factor [Paenibacillus sinensis]
MKEIDLTPLLIRMRQGDEEAFQIVYESTRDHAYRLIGYLTRNQHDVADIMSEVYVELFRSLHSYDPKRSFSSWFNGLIVRQVRNWKRKEWRLFRIAEKLKVGISNSSDQTEERRIQEVGDRLDLLPILQTLPLKFREVIVLRYYQDCTLEEIAELLKVPLGTVKSRHHQALKHLRRRFEHLGLRKEGEGFVY